MKKKIIIVCVLGIIIAGLIAGIVIVRNNSKEEVVTNPSRRDGQITNENQLSEGLQDSAGLEGMDGSLESGTEKESFADEKKAAEREENDSQLAASLESIGATEPTVANVDSVEVVLIPEAMGIKNGNAGEFYSNEDFEGVVPVDIKSFSRDELPAKYDSRDVDGKRYVSTVENQGYSYLCWVYASLGAVESDILKHHDIKYSDIDLSEKHMAYYNMHRAEGSHGGYIDNDYREFVNADNEKGAWIFDYDTNYIATGGVTDYCISLLTAWKGPVSEKGDDAFNSIFGADFIFKDNSGVPSEPYKCEYHVQAVNEIPANIENNTMIKQLIMEHGAVTAGICAEERFWKNKHKSLYSDYGGDEIPTADHEVIIVGWDDDYDKSNFSITPEGNGAWICRNSWGETTGEKGFFYMSYYDQTTSINNVAAYSVAAPYDENYYDNNYQAAGFLTYVKSTLDDEENYVTAYSEASNPYGIAYKAVGDETLEAIGLMGLETYQQYEISVFVNDSKEEYSDDITLKKLGKPRISMKSEAISGGYHTYELPKEIELAAGDEFFVMVEPVTKGKLIFESAVENISKPNYDEWGNLTGNVHNSYESSGCSYYISEDGKSMVRQKDKDFFIKAYTNNK